MQKEESEGTSELVETNKNLSAALDKLEQRCSLLDDKVISLKEFKKIVKNSTAVQCINCTKFIATKIFTQHLLVCRSPHDAANNIIPQLNSSGMPIVKA